MHYVPAEVALDIKIAAAKLNNLTIFDILNNTYISPQQFDSEVISYILKWI